MTDVLEQLRKAVGDPFVLSGAQVHDDYTHDEALTARPVAPRAVVLPASTGEVAEILRTASRDADPRRGPGQRDGVSRADASPWPTAS